MAPVSPRKRPRFRRADLDGLSIKQLKALLPWGDNYQATDKIDLIDHLITSNAVDLTDRPPVEYKQSQLRGMSVSQLKKCMNEEAGVFFDPKEVADKDDMIEYFKESGGLEVLSSDDEDEGLDEDELFNSTHSPRDPPAHVGKDPPAHNNQRHKKKKSQKQDQGPESNPQSSTPSGAFDDGIRVRETSVHQGSSDEEEDVEMVRPHFRPFDAPPKVETPVLSPKKSVYMQDGIRIHAEDAGIKYPRKTNTSPKKSPHKSRKKHNKLAPENDAVSPSKKKKGKKKRSKSLPLVQKEDGNDQDSLGDKTPQGYGRELHTSLHSNTSHTQESDTLIESIKRSQSQPTFHDGKDPDILQSQEEMTPVSRRLQLGDAPGTGQQKYETTLIAAADMDDHDTGYATPPPSSSVSPKKSKSKSSSPSKKSKSKSKESSPRKKSSKKRSDEEEDASPKKSKKSPRKPSKRRSSSKLNKFEEEGSKKLDRSSHHNGSKARTRRKNKENDDDSTTTSISREEQEENTNKDKKKTKLPAVVPPLEITIDTDSNDEFVHIHHDDDDDDDSSVGRENRYAVSVTVKDNPVAPTKNARALDSTRKDNVSIEGQVVVVVSTRNPALKQQQERAQEILEVENVSFHVVDAADPAQEEQRDELMDLVHTSRPAVRGKPSVCPLFYVVQKSGTTAYIGGWEWFEKAHQGGILKQAFSNSKQENNAV